ncbi:MAG TPA: D-2-hydroxyacid dehydrogenase [Ilumatobacteraceae bacterium]|nr:D-2-hydroxyacid dehydrogenase [Ilumatobacteraceae bacterium]
MTSRAGRWPDASPVGRGHVLLATTAFADEYADRLLAAAPGLGVVRLDESAAPSALDTVTIAFMSKDAWPAQARPLLERAAAAPRLEWLHVMSAGIDGGAFDHFRDRGVRVTRSAGASANAIGESVFMFLHALTRTAHRGRSSPHHIEWHRWRELAGRTIAVLGYGPIGQRIVELALAYGMQPTIVRQHARGDEPCPTVSISALEDVAGHHDVVVVALPLNEQTRGVVSRSVIERMGPDAVLINVARGALVDQRALTDALRQRRIGGAGLDVFEVEPLPPDDPLWDLPNVVITPHNAGSSEGGPRLVAEIFFANLERFLTGAPLLHEV